MTNIYVGSERAAPTLPYTKRVAFPLSKLDNTTYLFTDTYGTDYGVFKQWYPLMFGNNTDNNKQFTLKIDGYGEIAKYQIFNHEIVGPIIAPAQASGTRYAILFDPDDPPTADPEEIIICVQLVNYPQN